MGSLSQERTYDPLGVRPPPVGQPGLRTQSVSEEVIKGSLALDASGVTSTGSSEFEDEALDS